MEIRVPQLAEGISNGTVVSVLVSEGDHVKKDQTLLELETEKAVAPIPATADGKVEKIHVKPGDSVTIGQLILTLAGGNGKSAAAKPAAVAAAPSVPSTVPAAAPVAMPQVSAAPAATTMSFQYQSPSGTPPPASPTVRKIARELGIDLRQVRGSENGGRITTGDLRTYIQQLQQMAFQQPSHSAAVLAAPAAVRSGEESIDFSKWGTVERKPMSSLRKKIAERMVQSWTAVPHVTQFDNADISGLLDLRKKFASAYEKAGTRLTVTSFIVKAIVESLKAYPEFNASIDGNSQEIVYKKYYHIGLAVDTDQGLIVPVIRDVDRKSLVEVSKDIQALAEKTRSRKVGIEDLQGGTFTISNQGGIGGAHFTPIVNKPEVAILGVGQGSLQPIVTEGKNVEIRMILPLTLSYDHRLIDGGKAARFMTDFVGRLRSFPEEIVRTGQEKAGKAAKPAKKGKK